MAEETTNSTENAQPKQPTGNTTPIPSYLQGLPVQIDVLLGSVKLTVQELLSCGPGSVIDIGKKASEPFDMYVNNILVARGEVVMMHDRLGLKVVEVVNSQMLPS